MASIQDVAPVGLTLVDRTHPERELYTCLQVIGSGMFGYVLEAVDAHSADRRRVAIKFSTMDFMTAEADVLAACKGNAHCVEMLAFLRLGPRLGDSLCKVLLESSNCGLDVDDVTDWAAIVMPLAPCNLREYLHTFYSTREFNGLLRLTKHLTAGLDWIHRNGFVHGDIKAENILVHHLPDQKPLYMIADFGQARRTGCPQWGHETHVETWREDFDALAETLIGVIERRV
jgi:serine/threonine protein kinase